MQLQSPPPRTTVDAASCLADVLRVDEVMNGVPQVLDVVVAVEQAVNHCLEGAVAHLKDLHHKVMDRVAQNGVGHDLVAEKRNVNIGVGVGRGHRDGPVDKATQLVPVEVEEQRVLPPQVLVFMHVVQRRDFGQLECVGDTGHRDGPVGRVGRISRVGWGV